MVIRRTIFVGKESVTGMAAFKKPP